METKLCTRCHTELAITSFYTMGKDKYGRVKYQSWCKDCDRERCRQYHWDNRDKQLERNKNWWKNNKDKKKQYEAMNRKDRREYFNKLYQKNKVAYREKQKRYYHRNKQLMKEKNRENYLRRKIRGKYMVNVNRRIVELYHELLNSYVLDEYNEILPFMIKFGETDDVSKAYIVDAMEHFDTVTKVETEGYVFDVFRV